MYYVDSQRNFTRRDSSLVMSRKYVSNEERTNVDTLTSARYPSTIQLTSESGVSLVMRPKGSVQNEIVTMMFESMLVSIVDSWEVIVPPTSESTTVMQFSKTPSELTVSGKKKKSNQVKSHRGNKRSRLELLEAEQTEHVQHCWWSSPDERAVIRFRNGNVYEGGISMKCMNGEGRFQWADGTIYMGQFKENRMHGKGIIQWKNDTWYEGDFVGNVRHGRGLYVDSRRQRSYIGGWDCATKHGKGVIYFTETFENSYDGDWVHNVRHGFGVREYCHKSGYKGEWDRYIRDGNGLMIWSNHDVYKGRWKNGTMSGEGVYIWDNFYNNSMSLPSMIKYRGTWARGKRDGYGILNLGFGLGSYYTGHFKNNKKHGCGKFITNNGLILQDKNLFVDDNIQPINIDERANLRSGDYKCETFEDPYTFDLCENNNGYIFHVHKAFENIDNQVQDRAKIIKSYLDDNEIIATKSLIDRAESCLDKSESINLEALIEFEYTSVLKVLRCYQTYLTNIYYHYATICNIEDIQFTPILIRLYMWQMYYDVKIHEKGLTLVIIDSMFHNNRQWLSESPHDPFEKIYFWQFLHSLITVASKLYAKRLLPGPKPDTILASAFRCFMEKDVLPNIGTHRGHLVGWYGRNLPLTALYDLYCSLNEPHTVRNYLCAVRMPPHRKGTPQPPLIDAKDECLQIGKNIYGIWDFMNFVLDEKQRLVNEEEKPNQNKVHLKLFNFGHLSGKEIIDIFCSIFPQLSNGKNIMDLDIELTFFEFFYALIECAEKSIRVNDEEMQ